MIRSKYQSWLIPVLIIFSLTVFVLDTRTPIGVADFVFYFIPAAVAIFSRNPYTPLITALGTTLLAIMGYILSPSGIDSTIGLYNRIFATVATWAIAILVNRIIISRNENEHFTWIKNGMAELAIKIRGELSQAELNRKLLSFLSNYTGFKMATAYVLTDGGKTLEFVAGHALPQDFNPAEISLGNGLIGNAALEGKIVEFDNIPSDFYKISSSLGEMSPRYIIIVPLKSYDEVVAVLELSFQSEPSPLVKDFLKEMTEMAAVAIRSSQHKTRLAELLHESQQLSEELQAQQEELRVTNEELEQQTRAVKDSYTKMENQQAELEQTNQQLEEQAQILENQKTLMDERNRDLTQAQMALMEKTKELELSSSYKSEFLANMSHELRTPLNSSLILAKLLSDNKTKNLTSEQVKYAEIIYSSGSDLLNLINDILDLSKVEAGKLNIEPETIHLSEMIQSMDQVFKPLAMQKHLDFVIEPHPTLPKTIFTDRQRLEQILKNFLSNAFKFTQKGFVKLIITPQDKEIAFTVADSGIGIAPHQKEVIFEAFRQADGTTNRKYGGTGLGLSISKELTKLLHGNISVESSPGKGSEFTITIPQSFNEASTTNKSVTSEFSKMTQPEVIKPKEHESVQFSFQDDREKTSSTSRRILIIEDDETFAKILFDLAHEMNFDALVAPTGEEGLWLVEKHHPQAILLDIRLPDYNGLMVLDQLKMNAKTRHIPVHVLSSSDFSKSALEMGAMGYLMKPVKRELLQEAFKHLSSLLAQKMKHVLVVEDNEVQKEHITQLVSGPDIKVEAVGTAAEALERLSKKTYDCMVMDLTLPDLTGHELLDELSRENSLYSYPPVIIYTARDLTIEEEERLRKYSDSIIIKGAKSPERLLNEVTLFLHRVETDLPPERQRMLRDLRSREKSLDNRKILIVDDDVRNIFALTSALESYGANIIVARNGLEALDKVAVEDKLDLVLMDIMMPEMDGYEAIKRIRLNKTQKALPIIALTAKAMKNDQEKCLAVGANDYMAKPIDMDKLISLIRVWLPSQRSFIS
jgi:CheY-like chemotaxis protein/signal transduction histidine kinase